MIKKKNHVYKLIIIVNKDRKKNRNHSHNFLGCPKNAVAVELFGWVKPKAIPLLPATVCATISVQVGLEPPWLPFNIP